jgi:HEAT repeat protein
MSEMAYRRELARRRLATYYKEDTKQFMGAVLSSQLTIPDQFRMLLERADLDTVIQYRVLQTIADLETHELAPDLIRMFEQAQDTDLKLTLIHVLCFLGHDQAHRFLLTVLQNHPDLSFRRHAAYLLTQCRRQTYPIPALTDLVQNTKEDGILRSQALEALFFHTQRTVLPLILTLLQDDEPHVRWAALFCIQRSRDRSLKPFVESLLNDNSIARDGETVGARAQEILDTWARKST